MMSTDTPSTALFEGIGKGLLLAAQLAPSPQALSGRYAFDFPGLRPAFWELLMAAKLLLRRPFSVSGTDYNTP